MLQSTKWVVNQIKELVKNEKTNNILNSVNVSDGINTVRFYSDNENEIVAAKQYFMDLYAVEDSNEDTVGKIFTVYSIKSSLCRKMKESLPFHEADKIFYDMQQGLLYEDETIYCVIRKNQLGVTVFLKEDETSIYIRESDTIENVHLSQLIKEPLNSYKIANGYLLLHCAACSIDNKVVVFPAQKCGGKSTIVMGMLGDNRCKYLGNDSLFIKPENSEIITMKNPHAIRLGSETIENNRFLSQYLKDNDNCNKAKMYDASLILNNKTQIVPCILDSIFGKDKIEHNGMKISHFVFPTLKPESGENTIREVNEDEIISMMYDCYNSRDHRINWLPYYNTETLKMREKETFLQVLDIISFKCYHLVFDGQIEIAVNNIITEIA
mgnify:FL=1